MILLLLFFVVCAAAQDPPIPLWKNGPPGSKDIDRPETVRINEYGEHIVSGVHNPTITPYLPAGKESSGAAVIIAPGGGHKELWMDHEGYEVAQWLSQHGVAAFVLKYRLAREPGSAYTVEGDELADMQRAIRTVKSRAVEWGIDPKRVGVMGFSAGGELAALAGTRYDSGNAGTSDPVDRESSKPAFQALLYPGLSNPLNVSAETPPTFLVCGEDDSPGISLGVPQLYLALKRTGVSTELHVYSKTGHGFGLRPSKNPVSHWPDIFLEWLTMEGFVAK
jgi:endo-1,4-beta-xylanase